MATQLSKHSIAATLAALATTGVIACGGAKQPAIAPVAADEVPAAGADEVPVTVDEAAATELVEVEMPADQTADVVPGDATGPTTAPTAPTATDAAGDDAKPADDAKKNTNDKPSPPKATGTKPKPKTGAKKKAAESDGGCGAGTCG